MSRTQAGWIWLGVGLAGAYLGWTNRRLFFANDITTGENSAYPTLRSRGLLRRNPASDGGGRAVHQALAEMEAGIPRLRQQHLGSHSRRRPVHRRCDGVFLCIRPQPNAGNNPLPRPSRPGRLRRQRRSHSAVAGGDGLSPQHRRGILSNRANVIQYFEPGLKRPVYYRIKVCRRRHYYVSKRLREIPDYLCAGT